MRAVIDHQEGSTKKMAGIKRRSFLAVAAAVGTFGNVQAVVGFVKQGTGQRAFVIANPSNSDDILCGASLPNDRRLSLVTPEAPESKDFSG